uniref:Multifunctional fusion protein n=1 Tax=Scolopendra viridis TaxID=118503 RepID=A0A4D5R959_SCOVI
MLRLTRTNLKTIMTNMMNRNNQMSSLPVITMEDFPIKNEPLLQYLKNSKERSDLEAAISKYSNVCTEIPIVIGNEEMKSSDIRYQVMPFDHSKQIAKFHLASSDLITKAIKNCLSARETWEIVPASEKITIFQKAADLISGKYRMDLNASTMLGQGKNIFQAEIDAAAELTDFLRFNVYYLKEILKYKPISENPDQILNSLRFRGIEGFVAAISPFNFTAIGGNLASSPTLMGNVVIWKPSDTAILSNYIIYKVLREAGLPPGVINFVPADGPTFGDTIVKSPDLAGINFTGSVPTFRRLWQQVGENLPIYKNFPRLVGECGGKNYHLIHPSADLQTAVACTVRAAFEYSGQKCSACSRCYVAESIWPKFKEGLLNIHSKLKLGSPLEYETFLSAVIDGRSFERIQGYIAHAKSSPNVEILAGGNCDKNKGYFIEPTIIQTKDPLERLMQEEIFGPVLTIYVYPDGEIEKLLPLIGKTSPYALTGAIFAQDREFLKSAAEKLKMTAGNFYINDKSTGAVVGQQAFGGGRLSGTNDKAGGPHYLLRWTSPQTVKEAFTPLREWSYPYMIN